MDAEDVEKIFTAFIKPRLEYESVIWSTNFCWLLDLQEVSKTDNNILPEGWELTYRKKLATIDLHYEETRIVEIYINICCLHRTEIRFYFPVYQIIQRCLFISLAFHPCLYISPLYISLKFVPLSY